MRSPRRQRIWRRCIGRCEQRPRPVRSFQSPWVRSAHVTPRQLRLTDVNWRQLTSPPRAPGAAPGAPRSMRSTGFRCPRAQHHPPVSPWSSTRARDPRPRPATTVHPCDWFRLIAHSRGRSSQTSFPAHHDRSRVPRGGIGKISAPNPPPCLPRPPGRPPVASPDLAPYMQPSPRRRITVTPFGRGASIASVPFQLRTT